MWPASLLRSLFFDCYHASGTPKGPPTQPAFTACYPHCEAGLGWRLLARSPMVIVALGMLALKDWMNNRVNIGKYILFVVVGTPVN